MSKDFASIHTHTEFSSLDGASKIPELVARAKELGMSSLGISDHGNLSGLVDFYKECKKQEIRPVLGQEFYFTDDRTLKESVKQENENGIIDGSDKRYYHLSIYAEDNAGYQNLLKLSSDAFTNGFWFKPRSDYEILEKHSKGIIVGSGCLGGPVLQPLLHGNFQGALDTAKKLQDAVGKDNFFIELMNHGLPEQHKTNPQLIEIAKQIGAKYYCSQDSHYTHKQDANAHSILLCQPAGALVLLADGSNKTIETVKVNDEVASWRFSEGKQHESHFTSNVVVDVQSRKYDGELITLTTESGQSSTYTHDHICVVNASDAWLDDGNYIVYMQRDGDSFRIGKTTYQKVRSQKRPDAAVLGVLTRAKEQNAEAAWVLSVHKTEHEALEEEAYISWKYNIPTWSFPFPRKKGHEPRTLYYESLWNRVGSLYDQAEACLAEYGRDIRYPFWSINDITRHSKWTPYVRACNVLPGMMVCVANENSVTGMRGEHWEPIKVSRKSYSGKVYAIEVDENHTYIADGIVTHNCCQTGAKLSDPLDKRFHFHADEYYLKSANEMYEVFRDNPEACDNTLLIAERCNVKIDFDSLHLPTFPVPWGYKNDVEFLIHLVKRGIEQFYPEANDEVYDRAAYELSVFQSMGVSSYMLILWDLMKFARKEGIFTPPGRGSAAGSIVSYVLGITKVDPLKYDLIFERFLNPSRIALPDVDLDIEQRYRDKMINYTIEKYGTDRVAQIITFGRIKARTAVRDAARVLNYPPALGDKISKLMPPLNSGVDTPLSACFEYDEKYAQGYGAAQGLRELYDADPQVQEIVDAAKGIEGLVKSTGIHAAGVVIGDQPLDRLIPLWKNKDGVIATQWNKKVVEALGLVKMDYLGLKNLDILSDTEKMIGNGFKIDDLSMDDPETYAMLRTGETIGCFQIESSGMRSLLKRLKPSDINDISAVLALFRPGPMAQNWHNDYADRKNGRQAPTPFHSEAQDILESTYGLMIYQEQIMNIATKFAGYSLTEADNLRKIIGKKLPDEMKAEAGKFIAGCVSQGYEESFGKTLFDTIDGFSLYGFNRAHSVSYAFITYWTAYLKTHYPREYMAVLCSSVMNDSDALNKTARYLGEARRMGLKVYPPDLNSSGLEYSTAEDGIRIGLGTLRNMGEESTRKLIQIRAEKPFDGLYDFAYRVNPNVQAFRSLAYSGALDAYGTRQGIATTADEILKISRKDKKKGDQGSLFDTEEVVKFNIPTTEYGWHELLNREKETMGIFASGHPLDSYTEDKTKQDILGIQESEDNKVHDVLVIVTDVKTKYTKAQKIMATVTVEDQTGALEIVVFPKSWEDYGSSMVTGKILKVTLKTGTDFRDERNYVMMSAEEVESQLTQASSVKQFGVFLPKGFNSDPKRMSSLKGVLLQNHGNVLADIYISRSTKLNLGNEYLVNPTQKLKDEIKNLFVQYKGGV